MNENISVISPSFARYAILFCTVIFLSMILAMTFGFAVPVNAQQEKVQPYWVSINKSESRMRTGPGTDYPIKWVFKRKHLPMKVIAKLSDWRQVEDPDGDQGWMHVSQLSPERTAMVIGNSNVDLLDQPVANARVAWRAQPGVVGRIDDCKNGFCRIDVAGRAGYVDVRKIMGEESLTPPT